MPSAGTKELSLATSVGALNKLAQLQDKIAKNANPKTWLSSAEKVFKKAEHDDVMGDEENAYVFYMRFFNIMQEVTKTTKYQQDKKYYSSLVGKKTMTKAIDRAEKLSASLTKRYKKLELETKEAVEKERITKEKEQSQNDVHPKGLNGRNNTLKDIDDLLNGKKPSTQTSADVFKKLKVNHSSILSPNADRPDAEDPFVQTKSPAKINHSPAIDPVGLYELLSDVNKAKDVLVLDTRSKKDYEMSRINYSCCINIPDDLLKTSVMVGSIERKLPRTTWDQWIERGQKRHIVILDRGSKYKDITADSKVQCLKDAIYLYDTSCSLQSEPLILDGGFEAWLWHYPSEVTNSRLPEVQKTLPNKGEQDFSLDSLSYPELPVAPKKDPIKAPPDNDQRGTSDRDQQTSHSAPSVPAQPGPKLSESTKGGPPPNQHQPATPGVPNGPSTSTNVPTSTVKDTPGYPTANKPFLGPSNANQMIPGYPTPGYPTPGYPTPGYPTPGYPAPGYPTPGYPAPSPVPSPQQVPRQAPSMLSHDTKNQPMAYPQAPGKVDAAQPLYPPTHSNPPGSHVPNSLPSPRSQPPAVTQSGTHLNVTSHGNVNGQGPSPSHQPQQLGMPGVSLSNGQLPVSQATHNAQPQVGSSSPAKGVNSLKSNNQSGSTTAHPTSSSPQTSNVINNQGHQDVRPATNDVHTPAVSMAMPSTAQPAHVNTTQHPNQQNPSTPRIPVKPPSSHPPSTVNPPSTVANAPSSHPPSAVHPPSTVVNPPSSHPPSAVINPPSNHPVSAVKPQHPSSVGSNLPSKPASPTSNSISTPSTAGTTNTPTPVPNKKIPPTVPSVATSQQFIPQVPQSFTSSRTGMTHGLPPGWERVLDRRTGRYYFRDHTTKTTHWNLPASLAQTMNQSIMGQSGITSTAKEPVKKPSLKRSLSSPNLAKLDSQEMKENLSSDHGSRPMVNRRTKPLSESQLSNLSPAHGAQGKAMTGLRNLGNSCYMNSVLQCLIATAPLVKYILNSYYIDDINKTNPLGTGGRIAEELAVLTRVAHSGNYRHVSPVEFKRTIGRFASHFGGQQQQDSQEFLLFLLDQFHEDTNRVIKKAYIEEKSNEGLPDVMAAQLAWDNHKKRNQSIIVELLQGQFKSTLTCSVCNKQSVTFDAFMSLTLPIPTNGNCQMEDCIRLFTTKEKVSRDNKWFCPRCKQHREAWKTMEIWKLPPILIVHFNRFKRDYDGSWLEKRQTNVHFPLSNFDLAKFVLGPKKTLRSYNLYAVSNHYGSMQSGHYTAFCKNIYDKKWYKFDDSDVTHMSESSTKSAAAYILCYTSMEFVKP